MKVDIINIDDSLAAIALRSVLEYFGYSVAMQHVATSRQLVQILNGETTVSQSIVLMCHGVEEGLVLPELDPVVAAQQPYQKTLKPENFREFLHLPDSLVINTGCLMGKVEIATAFLDAGCHNYIGATDYPDGNSSLLYTVNLFYEISKGKSLSEAHQKASKHNSDTTMFKLYQK